MSRVSYLTLSRLKDGRHISKLLQLVVTIIALTLPNTRTTTKGGKLMLV